MIPGSGYGRNSKLFSDNNYDVVGIEISDIAFEMAKEFDPNTKFFNGSVLEMPLTDQKYDLIYCFNTLHLFLKKERNIFLTKCYNQLQDNGLVFFTMFSEKEKSYENGNEIEKNTFESKPGRPTHYFTKKDVIRHFKDYLIIETGIMEEQENHGEIGSHIHILRYIFAQKRI